MFLKPRKASTEPRLRSLLQKAVRRGDERVVESTCRQLFALGDRTWLRSRAVVITFEECWPLAEQLALSAGESSKTQILKTIASSEKQKDAAGLGSLAFAFHEGDVSVASHVGELRSIKVVSAAIDRPQEFFQWASTQAKDESGRRVILSAQKYLPAATWGWDKASILAGAFLATTSSVPSIARSTIERMNDFPFWVALDKHTPEGKVALREVCKRVGASYGQAIWAGFYCESAVTNRLLPSPWWECEKAWRLSKAGLSATSARDLWARVSPLLRDELSDATADLRLVATGSDAQQADLLVT